MYKGKKILAIIPARKGSKRILNKNIKKLAGKPLVYYTIKVALESKYIDKVIVSTDSPEIAKVASKYGADVPFLRPKNISTDKTSDQPVIKHSIEFMAKQNKLYDYILYLKPTAPLRQQKHIENAIKILHNNKLPLVRSVTRAKGVHHPYWMYKIKNNKLLPFVKGLDIKKYFRSQLLPSNIVHLNGVIEIFTREHAMTAKFIYRSNDMGYVEIPGKNALDIDELMDFFLAEVILKNQQK